MGNRNAISYVVVLSRDVRVDECPDSVRSDSCPRTDVHSEYRLQRGVNRCIFRVPRIGRRIRLGVQDAALSRR